MAVLPRFGWEDEADGWDAAAALGVLPGAKAALLEGLLALAGGGFLLGGLVGGSAGLGGGVPALCVSTGLEG
jgi:hypothetical protein